jgi:RecA-family ATPase
MYSYNYADASFPAYIQNQLNQPPPPSPGRHAAWMRLSLQMVGENLPDSVIFSALREWIPDADKPDKELRDLITGARQRNPQPAEYAQAAGDQGSDPVFGKSRDQLPSDLADVGPIEFLNRVFHAGEYVCITLPDSEGNPTVNEIHSREEWLDADFGNSYASTYGVWFCINPLKDHESRTDDNVSDFRHLLVEIDNGALEEQYANLKASGLPMAALSYSGNKSIHALVKIDASDAEEFQDRQKIVYRYLGSLGIDKANSNPARLSRLPGVARGEDKQRLLSWNVGAASFAEWQFRNAGDGSEFFDLDSLRQFDRENDPDCMIGNRWMCRGHSVMVQGPTGIGKSSFVLQMLMSWAKGDSFFGFQPNEKLKSVLIQAENDMGDIAEAFQDILQNLYNGKPSHAEWSALKDNVVILRDSSNGDKFVEKLKDIIVSQHPDIIFADNLFAYAGGNLCDQPYMTKFLRTQIQPILNETGVVIIFVHHTGKPPKMGEARNGSSAYAGFGTSELANWARGTITLIDDGRDGIYTVQMAKRGARTGVQNGKGQSVDTLFLRHAESGIFWESVSGIENQERLKEARTVSHLDGLRNYIVAKETVVKPWFETDKNWEQFGLSRDGCKALLRRLVADRAEGNQPIYLYKATVNGYTRKQDVYSVLPEGSTTIF